MARAKPKNLETSSDYLDYDNMFDADISSLHEYPGNPRKNDHAVKSMADMIETHGFRIPVLIRSIDDGYEIVDGHLRYKAAKLLGMEHVPAYLVDDMPEEQVKAFRVHVNKAAEWADWDMDKLKIEVSALAVPAIQIGSLTGLGDKELAKLSAKPATKTANTPKTTTKTKTADSAKVTSNSDTVTLTLTLKAGEREKVLTGLESIVEEQGLDSNSHAVLWLVEQQSKSKSTPRSRSRKKV